MPNMLANAASWLNNQRHKHLTRTVTYLRGINSVVMAATIGRTTFEHVDEFGVVHQIESRDFLVQTKDLILDSLVTLPEPGDQVREIDGNDTLIYEVMAPGNEPPFRYADAQRNTLRIHTKYADTET